MKKTTEECNKKQHTEMHQVTISKTKEEYG